MISMKIMVSMICIVMVAGCSVYRQDAQTSRVNTVTVDNQHIANPTHSDSTTVAPGTSDAVPSSPVDPSQSSWQYTGYVIDKKEQAIPAILFVWDVQAEQIHAHSVDDILQIASPNAIWLTTEDVAQADAIHVGDTINVMIAPNINTSFPAQGKLEQMQIVSDQQRISIAEQ